MPRRLRLISTPSPSLLARSRDEVEAFGAFYDAYHDRMLRYLARRVLDPELAFDLLSETFAKALERRRQFRGDTPEEEQGWLFAIARNELSHYWRSGSIERAAVTRYALGVATLSDAETDRIEALAGLGTISAAIGAALAGLPTDQRRAVELRVIRELPYGELAAALGVSEPTARARVSRGLRTLALTLSAPDDRFGHTA